MITEDQVWDLMKYAFYFAVAFAALIVIAGIAKFIRSICFELGSITDAELIEVRSKTTQPNTTGRIIAGQLLGGDFGALLGALSAQERTYYTYVFSVRWKSGKVTTEECSYQDSVYNRLIRFVLPPETGAAREYRLHSSKRAAGNAHELISFGELREGSGLKIKVDCESDTVKIYSTGGRILGHLSPEDVPEIVKRFANGTRFSACAGKVDYSKCLLETVKISALK